MKSYTTLRNLFGSLINRTNSTALTLGDQLINDGIRIILGLPQAYKFLETSTTDTTVDGQEGYFKPYNTDKIIAVKVAVGNVDYTLQQVKSRDEFNNLKATNFESDFVSHYYVDDRQVLLYPTPATTGNTITFYYKKRFVDLANADYTAGTVTVTNDDATVTGAGGATFTAAMVGRFFKADDDGNWYKIASFTDANNVELEVPYQGTTAAGASYTLAEMPPLPENYHDAPVYYALSQYWLKNKNMQLAIKYEEMFEQKKMAIKNNNISSTFDIGLVSDLETSVLVDPNDYPTIT